MITIKKANEIELLREGGKRLAAILRALADEVKPGVKASFINDRAAERIRAGGDVGFGKRRDRAGHPERERKDVQRRRYCRARHRALARGNDRRYGAHRTGGKNRWCGAQAVECNERISRGRHQGGSRRCESGGYRR